MVEHFRELESGMAESKLPDRKKKRRTGAWKESLYRKGKERDQKPMFAWTDQEQSLKTDHHRR